MAARKSASQLDMNNLKIINLATATTAGDAVDKTLHDTDIASAKSRATHTGTQLAATISDFNTAVRTNSLDQLAVPAADLNLNSRRLTSVLDPASLQDAATKNYVDTQLAGVVSGQVLKGSVRVATTANITLATPGATIDGVTLNSGDVVLLTGQSTASANGPYVWTGASAALTRATNWDTSAEAVLGSYWIVREGTQADKFALLTNDTAITLGTTNLTFAFIGATAAWTGYTATSPAVAAGGTWTVTHNKGTKTLNWSVYRTASPYDDIQVYGVRTDTNTLTITPDIAMAAGEYTAVVL